MKNETETEKQFELMNIHKKAKASLKEMEAKGVTIHRQWLNDDGWLSGFNVIHAVIEYKNKLYKIKWNDFNQGWMEQLSAGWGIFMLPPDKEYFIVYDMNNNGYSLGHHCKECLSKAYNNAGILNQDLKVNTVEGQKKCVFCAE